MTNLTTSRQATRKQQTAFSLALSACSSIHERVGKGGTVNLDARQIRTTAEIETLRGEVFAIQEETKPDNTS